ncbi:hypothetical protein METHP15_1430005 [Pseudomonas sp. P15-2025]
MHRAHGVNQRFLDRVVAVQRCGGVDGQGGIGPHGGVEGAEHRLEQFRGQGLEQCLVADRQAFLAACALRLLEQREVAERLPYCAAGAVAQQQGVAGVAGGEFWPGGEGGIESGHAGSVGWCGERGDFSMSCEVCEGWCQGDGFVLPVLALSRVNPPLAASRLIANPRRWWATTALLTLLSSDKPSSAIG